MRTNILKTIKVNSTDINETIPSAPLIQHGNGAIHVTRLEVINHCKNDYGLGRILTLYKEMDDFNEIELDYQDGGKTLKIFLS